MKRILILAFFWLLFCRGNVSAQSAAPKLLPFQGRLTDQNGVAVSNGVRLAQFKIFSVPTGGSPVWAGELHRTTVNGGLINIILGSKTPFTGVDFDQQLYLEITVDINGDSSITLADPPMLPRQAILPVVFAKESADSRDSRLLAGYDWTPVFGTNNPTIPLPASKLADGSLPGSKIQTFSITSNQIAPGSIGLVHLAPWVIGTNVGIGGYATTPVITFISTSTNFAEVPASLVSLQTSGRPVTAFLTAGTTNAGYLEIYSFGNDPLAQGTISLWRNGSLIFEYLLEDSVDGGWNHGTAVPSSSVRFFDTPPAGNHTYSLKVRMRSGNRDIRMVNSKLVVHEL